MRHFSTVADKMFFSIYIEVKSTLMRIRKATAEDGKVFLVLAEYSVDLFIKNSQIYFLLTKGVNDVIKFGNAMFYRFYIQSFLCENPSKFPLTIKSS